jgi:WD40 repeat protein
VQAVGVTPDGRHFIAGGKDHKIRIVDALGEVVRYYEAPSEITALDVRPDGHQIATACEDGTVRLWDFVPYDDHRTANEAKEPLWAAAVNADGTAFATAGADKIVRVYSPTGKLLHALEGSTAAVTSLAFLPENKLISAGGDKLLRLWDAKAGKPLGEWPGHTAAILALAATPDGRVVVSGTADKIVNGWNAETGKVIWTWTARSAVAALAITKDAKRVLVGTADGGLSVLSIDDGKVTLTGFANAHVSGVAAITFNADESAFASVGGDGIPKIWTLPASGPPLMALRLAPALVPSASSPVALSALAFSPDGRQIAVGGADKLIRLYDAKTGAELRNLRGCTDWITALAFSPGGDRLLAVSADKVARIFDVARIDPLAEVGHSRPVRAVAVSPDGQQIASVGEDRMIRLWNRATGAEVAAWPCSTEKDTLLSVCFAGPYLVTGGKESSSLTLWDRASKKEVASASIGQVFGLTPSADGKRLGVWSRSDKTDTYSVYDLPNLKQPAAVMVEKGGGVSAATFASNLSFVATGDSTGRVVLSDFTTKAPIGKPLQLQKKAVCVSRIVAGPGRIVLPFFSFVKSGKIADLGLSEDMQTLIAIDELGALYLVKLPSREFAIAETGRKEGIGGLLVAPRGRHVALFVSSPEIFIYDFAGKEVKKYALPSTPNNVAWTPDGKTLVTANADGSLYVMDVP